jgi:hypothetical protein
VGKGSRDWDEVCRESKGGVVELEWDDWKANVALKPIFIIPSHILSTIRARERSPLQDVLLVAMLNADDSNGKQYGSTLGRKSSKTEL